MIWSIQDHWRLLSDTCILCNNNSKDCSISVFFFRPLSMWFWYPKAKLLGSLYRNTYYLCVLYCWSSNLIESSKPISILSHQRGSCLRTTLSSGPHGFRLRHQFIIVLVEMKLVSMINHLQWRRFKKPFRGDMHIPVSQMQYLVD